MHVHPGGAPLRPGVFGEADFSAAGFPIGVVIEGDVEFVPVAGEQYAGAVVDDVVLEGKAAVVFETGTLDLGIAAQGEDVIADDVVLAVVLVEAAVGGATDEIILGENIGGSLVEVDAPAPVLDG